MSKTSEKTRESGSYRVFRAGSCRHVPQHARVANRLFNVPGIRFIYLGVRLVEVLDEFDQDTSRNHNAIKAQ